MSTKVDNAIDHLNKILPLAERQKTLKPDIADAYQAILNSYVDLGRSLTKAELAELVDNIDETIDTLRSKDMVVFDANDEPTGAYPFTMEERVHKVIVNGNTVHCMCALDALSVSPMFGMPTHINSRCHVTGADITIDQNDETVLNADDNQGLHFGISWGAASDSAACATSLCTEMLFLKDKTTADSWLAEDSKNREVFALDEAIEFASRFFKPLLEQTSAAA